MPNVQKLSKAHVNYFDVCEKYMGLHIMDNLASQFEQLNIIDKLEIKYLDEDVLNTQKSYVSYDNFNNLNLACGSSVFIKDVKFTYLCKIYPKRYLPNNIIEVDRSVHFTNDHIPRSLKTNNLITHINSSNALSEIDVEVVFDTYNDMALCIDDLNFLLYFIRTYYLNLLTITNRCQIHLMNYLPHQRLNINQICIKNSNIDVNMEIGTISKKSKVTISKLSYKTEFELNTTILPPLYEMESYLERLLEIINVNKLFSQQNNDSLQPPKQILLVGSSGCGKSTLVKLIAQITKSSLVSIRDHEISHKEPGETESIIRNLFEQAFTLAKTSGLCIINLEEVDNLCPKRKFISSHVQRAATQILLMLDKAQKVPGIIVIATTNKPHLLDLSIRRHGRLETEIYIAPPTETQRQIIIKNLILDLNLDLIESDLDVLSESVARMTPGFVGADLKQICQKIQYIQLTRNMDICNSLEFWIGEFRSVISSMTPASLKGSLGTITVGHITFDNLAALVDVKKSLEMAILWPIKHPESFKKMGITRPKGVLLYGPPGCAKTSLIRAIASLGTLTLLSISAAELYSPFVGDAERLVVKLFDRARQNSPCLIFIDEIDALAGSRSVSNEPSSDVQERILASLLTQMDGVGNRSEVADTNKTIDFDDGVIVVGATNRPDMIDAALLRPGRFDKHILVPPPDEEGRLSILKLVTKHMPLAEDVDLDCIASKTDLYSGADMKNICTEAALIAMSEDGVDVEYISNSHFLKALSSTRPSLTKDQIQQYYKMVF